MFKAYHDHEFIDSRDGRPLRILAEYLEPDARFEREGVRDTVIIFGSARIASAEDAAAMLADAERTGDAKALERARAKVEMAGYYEAARELARRLTEWSLSLSDTDRRFLVCTGGGPGIMEAANRGAHEAGGPNIGLTISLPVEEFENRYVNEELAFEFHYFFMRKFWFTYLAKAAVVMPGGFGTLDEMFETLTLIQTLKLKKTLPIVLFGTKFWDEVINLDALARYGMINFEDLDLLHRTDSVDEAYEYIVAGLTEHALDDDGPRGTL